ncbi:MAG: hypothetical protein HY744_24985 [Deltaproteobacteria bacterium]|nr:hypothetical protein [Deltaproteobacteria bacterium]
MARSSRSNGRLATSSGGRAALLAGLAAAASCQLISGGADYHVKEGGGAASASSTSTSGGAGGATSSGGGSGATGGEGGATGGGAGAGGQPGLKSDGEICKDKNECASGNCVDTFCCDGACDKECQRCDAPGDKGKCSPEAAGTADTCQKGMACLGYASHCGFGWSLWSKEFGGSGNDHVQAVAVDKDGSIILAGSFEDKINFGGGPLQAGKVPYIFIAKLDKDGNHVWSKAFGSDAGQNVADIALAASGNVILAGSFRGEISFGSYKLSNSQVIEQDDVFVAKIDSQGTVQWAHGVGDGAKSQVATGVAVDKDGSIAVVGTFKGVANFGTTPLSNLGPDEDGFAVKLGPGWKETWAQAIGGQSNQQAVAVALDAAGNAVVFGHFTEEVICAGHAYAVQGTQDVFACKLDGSGGQHMWSAAFGTDGTATATDLALDSDGNAILAGTFDETIVFGQEPPLTVEDGTPAAFVARLAADTGSPDDAGAFDSTGHVAIRAVAASGAPKWLGDVVLGGELSGQLKVGSKQVLESAGLNAFLLRYGPSKELRSAHSFGDDEQQSGGAVAFDPDGNTVLAGDFGGKIDLGTGKFASLGGSDIFLAKFVP